MNSVFVEAISVLGAGLVWGYATYSCSFLEGLSV